MPDVQSLLLSIAAVGAQSRMVPHIRGIEAFQHFFDASGHIDISALEKRDGSCLRRELILRFLVLSAVLDQGPDIVGVGQLLVEVTNDLYRNEVRFVHNPSALFSELGIAIDQIIKQHTSIKEIRSEIWARENQSSPARYNLFLDGTKQALCYVVFRWGVPLALPLLLERDEPDDNLKPSVLFRHLKQWRSAEEMSLQLKNHERYGLGKAIGHKACHLFAKWAVSSFSLLSDGRPNWGRFSFEAPFDSNAGRVLWRTGFFLQWANESDYRERKVVQPGAGKGGVNYIRVTNIRGMRSRTGLPADVHRAYLQLCRDHLCTHRRAPQLVEIQRIPLAYLLCASGSLGGAELDDGLIHIGTQFCLNHGNPKCEECPLARNCDGRANRPDLIQNYRT